MSAEPNLLKKHGWKVLGSLGGGAGGAVFKVQKDEKGPVYAAKVLRSKDTRPEPRKRFMQEVEAIKKLDHPAIIKIYDHKCDEEEGTYFYVMEYIEGIRSLKDLVGSTKKKDAENPFFKNAERSMTVYLRLLEGLQACEKAGIVHRDLSLGNVLVTPDSAVKIIDFGCCHVIDGETITLSDLAVGTPGYRAPECSGHTKDQPTTKADLYSAGKILWSMVTDKNTFDREKPVFADLSLNKQLPDAPLTWHLQHIFAKTIRGKSDHRYESAAVAIKDARAILNCIRANRPPLELISQHNPCPICGIGSLTRAGHLLQNQLVDHETWKSGVEDSDLEKELEYIPREMKAPWGNLLYCSYCGFGCCWSSTILQRNLNHQKTLD